MFHKLEGEEKLDLVPVNPSPGRFPKHLLALRYRRDQGGGFSAPPRPCLGTADTHEVPAALCEPPTLTLLPLLRAALYKHCCTGGSEGQDGDQVSFLKSCIYKTSKAPDGLGRIQAPSVLQNISISELVRSQPHLKLPPSNVEPGLLDSRQGKNNLFCSTCADFAFQSLFL